MIHLVVMETSSLKIEIIVRSICFCFCKSQVNIYGSTGDVFVKGDQVMLDHVPFESVTIE